MYRPHLNCSRSTMSRFLCNRLHAFGYSASSLHIRIIIYDTIYHLLYRLALCVVLVPLFFYVVLNLYFCDVMVANLLFILYVLHLSVSLGSCSSVFFLHRFCVNRYLCVHPTQFIPRE
ncbi:hypothetical protein AG1IA_09109 [Rhizoctonia solani AG-1 IA]|uniref:Uncharacterized protein n=1 Tax=Thanatephorus cucumeris (strain AG1-IA) TaxID=983506 RepID=L8WFB2_THACA|nr:hypothetical protein AG1IA_09109 [Rhizoctonia solani AG-1 IA]